MKRELKQDRFKFGCMRHRSSNLFPDEEGTENVLSQSWKVQANTLVTTPANDLKTDADLSTGFRDVFTNDGYNAQNNGCGTSTCRSFTSSSALGINAAGVAGVAVTP